MDAELQEIDADFRPEIERAWDRIERRIDSLPASLASLGRRYLEGRRPGGSHRDYFSTMSAAPLLYLPLWTRAALARARAWPADVPPAFLDDLLGATMWGYLYIRIQDDALDEPAGAREDLLFGNVCVHEMARLFDAATGGAADLRAMFEHAWMEFTACTLDERRQLLSGEPYPRERFEAHASKTAFARVPVLAVCRAAGRPDLEPAVTDLVQSLGVAYGLLNDVHGFVRDMKNGHRTYLLARAGWSGGEMTEDLRAQLYEGGLLDAFYREARGALLRSAAAAEAIGFGPEFDRFRARHERWTAEAARRLLILSVVRAITMGGDPPPRAIDPRP